MKGGAGRGGAVELVIEWEVEMIYIEFEYFVEMYQPPELRENQNKINSFILVNTKSAGRSVSSSVSPER